MSDTQPALPKSMKISGGMTTSKMRGNGWWFRDEGLRQLVSEKVQAPYVINHGTSIKDIAGQVDRVFILEEGDIELPIIHGPNKGGKKAWHYLTLGHQSTLVEGNAAYAEAAAHIMTTTKANKVPQESFSLQIGSINYDEETDQVIFEPPFRLTHHSLVPRGAFGPDAGVGITNIEFSAESEPIQSFIATRATSPIPPHITNLSDAVAAFSVANSGNPLALQAALRAGLAVEMEANGDEKKHGEAAKESSNTPPRLHPNKADHMPDPPETAATVADIKKIVEATVAPLKAQLEAAATERKAADERRLASEKERLLADYGGLIDEEGVKAAASIEALAPLERMARKFQTQNPGVRKAPMKDAAAAALKALDEDREKFLASISITPRSA